MTHSQKRRNQYLQMATQSTNQRGAQAHDEGIYLGNNSSFE